MKKEFKYPKSLENSNSLVAKYLTKDIFNQLKNRETKNGFTLQNMINSVIDNPD
ncbi:MAG: arginine kinase, partial [Campylobacterota bacterium]|nr:arginine kinase [Campylobacterota bacterium]